MCQFSYKCRKAFRRNFRILIFICACQMPCPLLLIYIFLTTSDNGRKPDGCHNVRHTCKSLPAAQVWTCVLPCWFPRVSHNLIIVAGLRDADRVCWGLEGHPKAKAGSAGRTPLLHCSSTYFRMARLHTKYTKISTIQNFPAIRYVQQVLKLQES